jgi:ParB-like chromosome segregation protein Spo0J
MNEVPIIVLEGLDDEKIKAFRLADNKLSEIADWDIQKLIEELQGIELDMTLFGFKKEKSV